MLQAQRNRGWLKPKSIRRTSCLIFLESSFGLFKRQTGMVFNFLESKPEQDRKNPHRQIKRSNDPLTMHDAIPDRLTAGHEIHDWQQCKCPSCKHEKL